MTFQTQHYADWNGGLNTADLPDQLRDNELTEILNMEYIGSRTLQTRRGTTRMSENGSLDGRCTSIHYFPRSDGTSDIIATYHDPGSGSRQRIREMTNGVFDSSSGGISPATTISGNIYWQWVNFNDRCFGVNGTQSANTNPITWNGSGVAVNLSSLMDFVGTVPQPKYCAVWGQRLWFAPHATSENTILASAVGTHLDFDTTGTDANDAFIANVGGVKDGDYITGLYPHRGRLLVFKRHHIYMVKPRSFETDKTQYDIILVSGNVGCRSAYTIQAVLGDVIFLSDYGFTPLSVVDESGDFQVEKVLSNKIKELRFDIADDVDTFGSAVDEENSVYLCSLPVNTSTSTVNNVTYVMDFKDPQNIKWHRWTGRAVGSTMAKVVENNRSRIYIGGYNEIYRLGDEGIYHDADDTVVTETIHEGYISQITTKDFAPNGMTGQLKFNYWKVAVRAISNQLILGIRYRLDQNQVTFQDYQIQYAPAGGVWDVDDWDEVNWAGNDVDSNIKLRSKVFPRRGQSIQFEIKCVDIDQAWALTEIAFEAAPISDHFLRTLEGVS